MSESSTPKQKGAPTREERLFTATGRAAAGGGKAGARLFGRVGGGDEVRASWADDADWARLDQEPLRARVLLRIALLVLVLLAGWASWAQLEEITRGEARVIPSTQLQVVQSVDGGVVEELLVKEGDVVEAGQVLVRVDSTRFVSSLSENRAEYLALQAKAARLTALSQGRPLAMPLEVLREAPDIAAHEQRLYESSMLELSAQVSIAREQVAQRQQELVEVRSRREQASRAYDLVMQELEVTRPLLRSGAVSEVDLLRLERDVARLRGERDQAAAQISRIQAAISESSRKIQEIELNVRNQQRNELSTTLSRLGSLSAGSRALQDRVQKAEVRAPVRGTVSRLLVNTVGGVVQPGREVAEIVPLDDALVLEARIQPKDIGFLRPGQPAMVKFTAYDFAIYGGLEATVEQISADSITDEKGNTFYEVRVRTLKTQLGEGLPIIPGMTAQVDIITGKKSVLAYLFKPVLRATSNALSER